jgi:hypothetical protein
LIDEHRIDSQIPPSNGGRFAAQTPAAASMEPGKDYPTAWGGHPATPGMTAEEQYIFDLSGVSSPASASASAAALRHRSTVAASRHDG